MFQVNYFILFLLALVLYLSVTKYCMGLSTGQCSANLFTNTIILLKYLVQMVLNMLKGIGQGVAETPAPTFEIYKYTEKPSVKKNEEPKKDSTSKKPEEFAGYRIHTTDEFQRAKEELEAEIRKLQGDE